MAVTVTGGGELLGWVGDCGELTVEDVLSVGDTVGLDERLGLVLDIGLGLVLVCGQADVQT